MNLLLTPPARQASSVYLNCPALYCQKAHYRMQRRFIDSHSRAVPTTQPQVVGNRQQANGSRLAQQQKVSRRPKKALPCIYTSNAGQHRRVLERRSALALSCTERQTITADLLGDFGQSAVRISVPKRLRIAVDVDEGELQASYAS